MTDLPRRARRSLLVLALMTSFAVSAQSTSVPDPADPASAVPAMRYESVFEEPAGAFDRYLLAAPLPWTQLYRTDGTFVPEAGAMSADEIMTSMTATTESGSHSHTGAATGSHSASDSSDSDATGVVKKLYVEEGKVKLKHGPIERLDMPGMTMVFHLKEPEMMRGLEVGDEVGFDVVVEGNTFYIVRIRR